MENLYINPEWTYKEIVSKIKVLKFQYDEILTLFSYFSIKYRANFIRNLKTQIYSLQFEEWKRDRIWEYLNGDEEYETLLLFIK